MNSGGGVRSTRGWDVCGGSMRPGKAARRACAAKAVAAATAASEVSGSSRTLLMTLDELVGGKIRYAQCTGVCLRC